MKILVVEDDARLRNIVRTALERANMHVVTASDGRLALTHAAREAPDLIVLDVGLPHADGFEVCRQIRTTSDVPILFLTAHDDEVDRILGLELGGDDYVTKPFSPRELVARIRAILKRTQGPPSRDTLRHGRLTFDVAGHQCRFEDTPIPLTAREFGLLQHLMERPGQMHTRSQMIDAVWGPRSDVADRTLDSHLRNIRKKLADAGCANGIETVHGVGIRLGPCDA